MHDLKFTFRSLTRAKGLAGGRTRTLGAIPGGNGDHRERGFPNGDAVNHHFMWTDPVISSSTSARRHGGLWAWLRISTIRIPCPVRR